MLDYYICFKTLHTLEYIFVVWNMLRRFSGILSPDLQHSAPWLVTGFKVCCDITLITGLSFLTSQPFQRTRWRISTRTRGLRARTNTSRTPATYSRVRRRPRTRDRIRSTSPETCPTSSRELVLITCARQSKVYFKLPNCKYIISHQFLNLHFVFCVWSAVLQRCCSGVAAVLQLRSGTITVNMDIDI